MGYTSNYLGQLEEVRYPDGERVSYAYNTGGQIQKVSGMYLDITFPYVDDIGYDEFGQRIYMKYGNGVETHYTYDEKRRWLDTVVSTARNGEVIQNIDYTLDYVGNVSGYTNKSAAYETNQHYTYDALYQLTGVEGNSTGYVTAGSRTKSYQTNYSQRFSFEQKNGLYNGNFGRKVSEEATNIGSRTTGDYQTLTYDLDYQYARRAERIGKMYYRYDDNGNLMTEQFGNPVTINASNAQVHEENGVYSTEYGFAITREGNSDGKKDETYRRDYSWNERNLMTQSVDTRYQVQYRYGADGQRAVKYTVQDGNGSQSLYFNTMFQMNYIPGLNYPWEENKHIFVGETRIATKRQFEDNPDYAESRDRQYFYHGDHLGSAQLVTDGSGQLYEHIEYTPYGELWVERAETLGGNAHQTPFRFTGKEMDRETGLYYYGARYLDPHTSMWLSADPAMGDYIPQAPINDEAKKHNQNLPGMGGVYNYVNLHVYHYAGNNPVVMTDPDGRQDANAFVRAEANGNNVRYYRADQSGIERSGGSRAWRNNNPGNIRGAGNEIGNAGGFAVFADYETGFNAIITLLRGQNYRDLTINEAILRYAPPEENDTDRYQEMLAQFTGLDNNRKISSLSDNELISVARAIQRIEGYSAGRETPFNPPNQQHQQQQQQD